MDNATTAQPGLITLSELEHAINYWRDNEPHGELSLGPIARHLAKPYGLMIYNRTMNTIADVPMSTTAAQRASHVSRMRASFAIEGQNPDADDIVMQTRYVEGSATLADMLAYAHSFARQHAPMPSRTVSGFSR